jgi:cation diffusion facilitator family transporter
MALWSPLIAFDGHPVEIENPFTMEKPIISIRNTQRKLIIAVIVCLIMLALLLCGGTFANSVALLMETVYMTSKFSHYLMGIVSMLMVKKQEGASMTFGYFRVEVLATFLSIIVIWIATAFLIILAVHRLTEMVVINAMWVMITSFCSFACTTALHIFILIRKEDEKYETPPANLADIFSRERENLTFKDIFVICIGDFVKCTFMVMIGLTMYLIPDFAIVDSLAALAFALLIISSTVPLMRDAGSILLEATPPNFNVEQIIRDI